MIKSPVVRRVWPRLATLVDRPEVVVQSELPCIGGAIGVTQEGYIRRKTHPHIAKVAKDRCLGAGSRCRHRLLSYRAG